MGQNKGRIAVAFSFAIFAVFTMASTSRRPGESPETAMLFAAAFLPIYWLAAAISWSASRGRELDARGRRAWELIALANAAFGTANLLFFLVNHVASFPAQRYLILIVIPAVWYFAMFAGLARLPRPVQTNLERSTFWLDIATVLVSGLLILLYVFAHTPGTSSFASVFTAITTIGVPALNCAVIFAALVVILRPAHGISREAVTLIAVSVALIVVADLGFARTEAASGHRAGIWYEPLYLLSACFATAAAQMQRERPGDARPRQFDIVSIQSSVLPYIAVGAAVFVVILEVGDLWRSTLGRMVLGAVVLTGLVMARQLIARRHLMQLATAEQARLAHQAALEVKLQQSQKLEAVGLLAGGIAHDFNNILTAIRGTAELAAMSPETLGDDMKEIMRTADHGTSLTRQLLAFSRRDAIQVERFDLREAVQSVEALLRRLVSARVAFRVTLAPEPVLIEMDRGQVEQVLMNLSINARDAMPEGGTLSIAVEPTRIDGQVNDLAPGDYARLAISDTGHGMPPEVIARMFEPFYTTKPRGRGSGLGLATVYAVVKRAGGTIKVSSTVDSGTALEVLFPLAGALEDVRDADAAAPGRADTVRGRATILVVDDDDAVRDLVGKFLSRTGYTVISASSGPEALAELAADRRVDLLLTDLVMPGMTGGELVDRARAIDPALRIVCMSGHAEPGSLPGEGMVPAANFIEKPFALSTLERHLRSALDAPVPDPAK